MTKVSIIMATYNCEKTVAKSIDSIINQTYSDWQFVICDDCSEDGTYEILKDYYQKYPEKFVILRNDSNSKLSYSLNRCLDVSEGEYIARMDGDDVSAPERLKKQVEFLDLHKEYAVVGTAMIPFDGDEILPVRYAKEEPTANDMVSRSPFFHATIMMRKEVYDAIDRYTVSKRTVRAQDYDMWFRFFAKGYRGYNIHEGLYYVCEDSNAIRRRTFITRANEVKTKLIGYKLLNYPWYKYVYAFKPLIAAMVPVNVMKQYHKITDKNS